MSDPRELFIQAKYLAEAYHKMNPMPPVEDYIALHEEHRDFLEPMLAPTAHIGLSANANHSRLPAQPDRIGPYRIIEKIADGGMGTVYRAEQGAPVRRQVGIKVIKHGWDNAEILARFAAERQALALMNHPNIGAIYDTGSTKAGSPYFVMEFIEGCPITEYCDKYRLNVDERLALFKQVCSGVQHAHHKGIIHRDLKPSNVLVAFHDDGPLAKVIDFGIAKATRQSLTNRALLTEHGRLIGTPHYMSPEQADFESVDIDTRTDVYSLGVLLYELLAGVHPLNLPRMRQVQLASVLQLIREAEPTRPSSRISATDARSTESAKRRCASPNELRKRLRADLDWIVLKALEKDRTRRYTSAADFEADIDRHLRHEPTLAGPPNFVHASRKYVRRHRIVLSAASLVFTVLVASFILVRGSRNEAVANLQLAAERLDAVNRMADVKRLTDLEHQATEELWPASPAQVEPIRTWLAEADEVVSRIQGHERDLNRLRSGRATDVSDVEDPAPKGPSIVKEVQLTFATAEDRWMHDTISAHVGRLHSLAKPGGLIERMRERLSLSQTIANETITRHESAWDDAIASIKDVNVCPMYSGLVIKPQLGLIPIGRDQNSGLWEFGLWKQAGSIPERGKDGKLILEEQSGLVFVLIPGGSVEVTVPCAGRYHWSGTRKRVRLEPFLLSKFEMTQGQWERLTGNNPSMFGPHNYDSHFAFAPDEGSLLLHPVERVSWYDCRLVLRRIGLQIPTYEQLAYAMIAGNAGPRQEQGPPTGNLYSWSFETGKEEDGYSSHAPVGRFGSNSLGLCDLEGNVAEWCGEPQAGGDLIRCIRDHGLVEGRCITYGGSFIDRVGFRRVPKHQSPEQRNHYVGVRPARNLND